MLVMRETSVNMSLHFVRSIDCIAHSSPYWLPHLWTKEAFQLAIVEEIQAASIFNFDSVFVYTI